MSFVSIALGLMEFAPLIAKIVNGNESEKIAEKVVKTAKIVTGGSELEDISESLRKSPEAVLEFRREAEKIVNNDRANARMRDISLFQVGRRNIRSDIMVLSALLGLLGCLGALTVFKMSLSGEVVGIISTIAGIFGSCLKDAYAFEFGSSRGSKEKESRLIELLTGTMNRQ